MKDCDWSTNVANICTKALIRLNLMRSLKFRVSRKPLEKMYFAYIHPLLEYSDVAWDNCSTATKKQLDPIHIEAARMISGASKQCGIDRLFGELGWNHSRQNAISINLSYSIRSFIAYPPPPTYLTWYHPKFKI